ncbi:MAG: DUF6880 family protein [Methylocella sp.]|nr:MAG: hypothetical protein DLM68_13860 [Hyphomicrobiales bacterium]
MPSKKTLNAKNLESLGAQRLAELLIEVSTSNAAVKRRLRLELAGSQSPGELAKEIRKRLTTIARSRTFVDWQNRRTLIDDLEAQRRAIVNQIANTDPSESHELMWRFMALANSIFERCDDSSGMVIGVFHTACRDLGEIALAAQVDPEELAGRVFNALNKNDYGQYDELIDVLSPALGSPGLAQLKERFLELSEAPPERPKDKDRKVIGWSTGGPLYADEITDRRHQSTIRLALQEIADAQGDVDGFIAQQSEKSRTVPSVASKIARRLLNTGRLEEAWTAINAIDESKPGWIPFEWEEVRLDLMETLGRKDDAQRFRWQCFERGLNGDHLRAFLKRLPDFDDLEAEERAMSYALRFPGVHQALAFLVSWPALDKAATLVTERSAELEGNHYEILSPAADALAAKHPLAATLLLRAMIDFALKENRVKRYRHAARHLLECAGLAAAINDFGRVEPHDRYRARLKAEYGRRTSFWSLIS